MTPNLLVDLLLGFLLSLPFIQFFNPNSWVIRAVETLILTTVIVSLIFELHPVSAAVVIVAMLLNSNLMLNNKLKFGDLLALNILLLILILAAYLAESTAIILLSILTLVYLVAAVLKSQAWRNWLLILLLNLSWLILGSSGIWLAASWLITALLLWQVSQTKSPNNAATNPEQLQQQLELAKTEERSRIYQNIHDDVGAELLKLIYQLSDDKDQTQVKNIMNKLRQAVANTAHITTSTELLLHEICAEARSRCGDLGIQFTEHISLNANPSLSLTQPIHLQRYIRELISNCLKHANAQNLILSAAVTEHSIVISLKDDGKGIKPENKLGKGMTSLTKRIKAEGGDIIWQNNVKAGTVIHLTYPL